MGHSNEESSSEVIVQVIITNIALPMHLFEVGIRGIWTAVELKRQV